MAIISFLGDLSLNDHYNKLYKQESNPFNDIEGVLKESDFVIANLECVSIGDKGENLKKRPRLKTNTETLNYLKTLNISAVSLAHNHIFDNLTDGYDRTIQFLNKNNIKHLGAGKSTIESSLPIEVEIDNKKFIFLNYVHDDTNPSLPNNCPLHLNNYSENKIIEDINQYKQKGNVILLLHWGGNFEGGLYPDQYQPKAAKKFIDAGANLIIGHHSHTLQPYEIYKGKYIFYSLGNFCFADIYSDNKVRKIFLSRELQSIILKITITEDSWIPELIPIKNENNLIIKSKNISIIKRRNFIYSLMKFSSFFWYIYRFNYTYILKIYIQLKRKDDSKTFIQRITTFDLNKLKMMFK